MGGITSAEDVVNFGKFIATNRSYAWRNITVIDKNTPNWKQTVLYNQGKLAHRMHFILSCRNASIGTEVAISCSNTCTTPPIYMARTKITQPNQDLGVVCDVPANFLGNITYSFWRNGASGGNMEINLHAVIFTSENHPLYQYAKHHEELGFRFPRALCQNLRIGGDIGPEKAIILGQYSIIVND